MVEKGNFSRECPSSNSTAAIAHFCEYALLTIRNVLRSFHRENSIDPRWETLQVGMQRPIFDCGYRLFDSQNFATDNQTIKSSDER